MSETLYLVLYLASSPLLFLLACANLVVCAIVGIPLFFGMRKIRRLIDIDPTIDSEWPKVSIVVAARNEERDIEAGVRSLLSLDYDNCEILVVNDRSTDRTGEILDAIVEELPRLRVVHLTELPDGWLGKNHALYYGAQRAEGEFILFTDADVVMEPTVLRRAVAHMVKNEVDHLPMLFEIRMPNWLLDSFVVTFSVYLMTYCRPWNCPHPNRPGYIGIGGFNLVRADVYQKIGTHEVIRMRPDDDLKFGKLVKREGFKQELLNGVDLMYVPWYASLRELIVGLEKNAFSGVDYHVGFAVFAGLCMLALNVFPFIGVFITSGMTQSIYVAVVLSLLAMGAWSAYHCKIRLSCCLGFPIAAFMFVYIQWRAVILNLWHGGIRWRDTHYPLAELKANKIEGTAAHEKWLARLSAASLFALIGFVFIAGIVIGDRSWRRLEIFEPLVTKPQSPVSLDHFYVNDVPEFSSQHYTFRIGFTDVDEYWSFCLPPDQADLFLTDYVRRNTLESMHDTDEIPSWVLGSSHDKWDSQYWFDDLAELDQIYYRKYLFCGYSKSRNRVFLMKMNWND